MKMKEYVRDEAEFMERKFSSFLAILSSSSRKNYSFGRICRQIAAPRQRFDDYLSEETGMSGKEIIGLFRFRKP